MEAANRPRRHAMSGDRAVRLERHDEAFITSPGIAHPEQGQAIEHRGQCNFGDRMKDDRKQPAGAGKIALPQIMAACAG